MKKLIICAFTSLALSTVSAEEFNSLPDKELFALQQEADVAELRQMAKSLVPRAQSLTSGFVITHPDQFIIYRVPYQAIALARWGEHYAVIGHWKKGHGGSYLEISAKQWRAAYKAIAAHVQQPPSKPKIKKYHWTRGYSGIVQVYDSGKVRNYLLSTDDIYEHHHRGPIQSFLCDELIPHCGYSDWNTPGWMLKLDEKIKNAPGSLEFERNYTFCANVTLQQFNEAEQLLAGGADIDGWQPEGDTCYAQLDKPRFIKSREWLINHKASVTKTDYLGKPPKP